MQTIDRLDPLRSAVDTLRSDGSVALVPTMGALQELSKRAGFRVAAGLSERVIFRELFPSGLTLLDKGYLGDLGTSHLVARQEVRQLIAGLNLHVPARNQLALAEPA
jgi:hypothetical protein